MARLTTYQTDTNVTGTDKVLGTDTGGATKNYTLDSVGEYFTQNNVVTVAGQLSFVFEASVSEAGDGQFFANDGTGGVPALADITKLNVSTKYSDGASLEQMLNEIIADKFFIVEARNQNVKAVLTTQSYAENASDSTYKDITVIPKSLGAIAGTNDDFRWSLHINPTISGTFTYVDLANSAVQVADGAAKPTVTADGIIIASGYASKSSKQLSETLNTALRIGSTISGVQDELVLVITPLSANLSALASLEFRELL